MPAVIFKTLGCKLNQAETAALAYEFEKRGYTIVNSLSRADVFLLNTCTVTGRSAAKTRKLIRQVIKEHPGCTIVVLGCHIQVAREEIKSIPGVDYILGTKEKQSLFDFFKGPGKLSEPFVHVADFHDQESASSGQGRYRRHTRATIKIQDGCDNRCSYCIVPFARGPCRSVPPDELTAEMRRLLENGFKEIVLTGVHVGDYGKDRGSPITLPELLSELVAYPKLGRIRLSSLNIEDLSDDLIHVMSSSENICRHLHLSLQSGSDTILEAMKRPYDTERVKERIATLQESLGMVGLGADIIVGFPGESEELFQETVQTVIGLPLTYLHVFPYSPRPGTVAAAMRGQIPPSVKSKRAAFMRQLGADKKETFLRFWLDREVEVLLEGKNEDGFLGGFTSEYVRVEVPYQPGLKNCFVVAKTEEYTPAALRGEVIRPV